MPADWERVKKVVMLRNRLAPQTLIIGNGDVTSLAEGRKKAAETGCDGVMVGRALFGNPWFFDASREVVAALPQKRGAFLRLPFLKRFFDTKRVAPQSVTRPITVHERLEVLVEHAQLFELLLGDIKSFAVMKKHFKAYCTGFSGAKELRIQLMEAANASEVKVSVERFFATMTLS